MLLLHYYKHVCLEAISVLSASHSPFISDTASVWANPTRRRLFHVIILVLPLQVAQVRGALPTFTHPLAAYASYLVIHQKRRMLGQDGRLFIHLAPRHVLCPALPSMAAAFQRSLRAVHTHVLGSSLSSHCHSVGYRGSSISKAFALPNISHHSPELSDSWMHLAQF
jgi:hypothetical protein